MKAVVAFWLVCIFAVHGVLAQEPNAPRPKLIVSLGGTYHVLDNFGFFLPVNAFGWQAQLTYHPTSNLAFGPYYRRLSTQTQANTPVLFETVGFLTRLNLLKKTYRPFVTIGAGYQWGHFSTIEHTQGFTLTPALGLTRVWNAIAQTHVSVGIDLSWLSAPVWQRQSSFIFSISQSLALVSRSKRAGKKNAPKPSKRQKLKKQEDPDQDGDGFFDIIDACPKMGSDQNVAVDNIGCPKTHLYRGLIQKNMFTPGTQTFESQGEVFLQGLAKFMKGHPKLLLTIETHGTFFNDPKKNLELTKNQAGAIKDKLTTLGISQDHIKTIAYGARYPIIPSHIKDDLTLNNRIEIKWAYKNP